MLPVPSREALLSLWGAVALVALGWLAGAAWLVSVGGAAAACLCAAFALTVPAAARLRRQRVELSWWVEPSRALPVAGGVFEVHASLRNHGDRDAELQEVRIIAPRELEIVSATIDRLVIPACSSAEFDVRVRARAVGRAVMLGMIASAPGPAGLFSAAVRFPIPLAIKVLPRAAHRALPRAARATSETVDRATRSALRIRGAGTELHEIREYQPGDPFGAIAWKPSARAGRLMVREVEREAQIMVAIILDASATMRGGYPGHRKLDWAIELSASMARDALAQGAHVALRVVDGRTVARVPFGEGNRQLPAIYDALIQITEVVDEDLTDITEEALTRRVASYLRQHEGVDVFRSGAQIDRHALGQHVARALEGERTRALPIASSRALGRLRRFCQLRGITLPYRIAPATSAAKEHKAQGLLDALRAEASDTRATRSLIVISDLDGLPEPSSWTPTLAMLARRGHGLQCFVPMLGSAESESAAAAGAILASDLWRAVARVEAQRLELSQLALRRVGVAVRPYYPPHEPRMRTSSRKIVSNTVARQPAMTQR